MIPVTTFAGKTVAVFGLGGSGLASCHALKAGGAEVVAWDDDQKKIAEAAAAGFETADLRQRRLVEGRRPGALARRAADASRSRIGRSSCAQEPASKSSATSNCSAASGESSRRNAPFVAITGTNGKSTTTALIHHLLRHGRTRRAAGRQYRHRRSCRSSRRAASART